MMKKGIIIILGIIILATGAAYMVNAAGVVLFGGNLHRDVNDGLVLDVTLASDNYASSTKTFTDNSRGSNHCVSTNAAVFTVDNYGKSTGATIFNGTTNVITRSTLNLGNAATFSGWGKADALTTRMLWNHPTNSYGTYFDLFFGNNLILMNTGDGYGNPFKYDDGTNIPMSAVSLNVWHHYVVVLDPVANKSLLYVDGVYWGSAVYKNPTSNTSRVFSIGGATSYRWSGAISSLKIHNRALSAKEVLNLYGSSKPKFVSGSLQKGLVLDMPLTSNWTKSSTAGSQIMTDRTPYSNDGKNYGAVISSDFASFDGNDYIADIVSKSILEPASITVSSWINMDTDAPLARNIWLTKWHGYSMEIQANTRIPYFRLQGPGDTYSNTALTLGEWHHFVGTYDSAVGRRVYLDGNLVGSGGPNGAITHTRDYPLNIGRYSGGIYFKGKIKNVKIYDRALSAAEILSLYDKER